MYVTAKTSTEQQLAHNQHTFQWINPIDHDVKQIDKII